MDIAAWGTVAGVPVVGYLAAVAEQTLPGFSKGRRLLVSLACSFLWAAIVAVALGDDLSLIAPRAILLGLAAANPIAVATYQERDARNDKPDPPIDSGGSGLDDFRGVPP